jgi:hypothetical protein
MTRGPPTTARARSSRPLQRRLVGGEVAQHPAQCLAGLAKKERRDRRAKRQLVAEYLGRSMRLGRATQHRQKRQVEDVDALRRAQSHDIGKARGNQTRSNAGFEGLPRTEVGRQ